MFSACKICLMNIKEALTQPNDRLIMKKIIILSSICIFTFAFALCAIMPSEVGYCAGVLDILSPKAIEFYEGEIAGRQVVSNKSYEWLERVGSRYNISAQKVRAVLVVQDFCKLCGEDRSFAELAKCQDLELLVIVKEHVDVYLSLLDDAKKEELKQKGSELFLPKSK